MMKRFDKKENLGITLIALVITIIILLILAGISIAQLTGNGLFSNTKIAKEKYDNATVKEDDFLKQYENAINSGEISSNREDTDELKQKVLNMVYPVGSIYIGTTNVNPSTFIGGTWEIYGEGRTIVGAGTGTDDNNETKTFAVNATGGEYNHQLSVTEMPSHSHTANYNGIYMKEHNAWGYHVPDTYAALRSEQTLTTSETGGSQSHNNIQPYIVTYMWKRIN